MSLGDYGCDRTYKRIFLILLCAALDARQFCVSATPAADKYPGGFDAGLGKKKTVLFARFQLMLNYFQTITTYILRFSYQNLPENKSICGSSPVLNI